MKTLLAALLPLSLIAGPLDDLVPMPRAVTPAAGVVSAEFLRGHTVVKTGDVPGAPAATRREAYILDVTRTGATVTAPDPAGARWAQVTLDQLAKLSDGQVPCCRIVDWPQFPWRGFMHDSGRNFLAIPDVKAVLDAMQRVKMNLFHWHFTEFYGWRLESKKYPVLNSAAAGYRRYLGQYYTQDEFREIVDYAHARGITVMPEFDMPGHALVFRRAFGFQTMRDEGVREKLCDLVDELCSLVPAEKMPFIHLGTDEARQPEEKVPPKWLEPIVARVHAAGRTVVGWTPGELAGLTDKGPVVGMRWGRPKSVGDVGVIPFFDASGMYLDDLDPFEFLGVATYRKICPWNEAEGARLGAITCAWHDDFAGDGRRTLVNQAVFPALVLFGDAYWRGREAEQPGVNGRVLPRAANPALARAADLERRVAAQRDKVWADWPYAFQFLKQTDLRWRVSQGDGTVVADDVTGATIFFWQNATAGTEGAPLAPEAGGNLFTNRTGLAIAETWIKSPKEQDVGAWIGFTDFARDHGRARSAPTPALGQWSRFDATVEINGTAVPPPYWEKPGQLAGADTCIWYVHELDEVAFANEEYYMRAPTPIHLKAGWNHVKLTVPMKKRAANHQPWVATFIPLLGSTEHPREVPGLEYRSAPPAEVAVNALNLIPQPQSVTLTGGVYRQAGATLDDAHVKEMRDGSLPDEGYRLDVAPDGIAIVSKDDAGTFYARKTLAQLVTRAKDGKSLTVPCLQIVDQPAYRWRGFLLDEGRHFFGKETVRRLLDLLADYKFNVFHWHLTEDQGWRIDVPGLPELAKCGSVRPYSAAMGSSLKRVEKYRYESTQLNTEKYGPFYYTADDLREIVAYAAARHIQVVPEIEIPGHSRGALAAYPNLACDPSSITNRMAAPDWGIFKEVLCVGNDETLRFCEKVLDFVCDVFPSPVIHIGGDECPRASWETCPKCQARIKAEGLKDANDLQGWITRHMANYLAKKGRRIMGWDEILAGSTVPKTAIGQSWRTNPKNGDGTALVSGAAGAANGYDIVMSPHELTYYSYRQGLKEDPFVRTGMPLPLAKAYTFNPSDGVPEDCRHHILGGQCCLWGEYLWNDYDLAWRTWPRGFAMAEILWSAPAKRDYEAFRARAAVHRAKLIHRGYNCAPLE